MVQSFEMDFPQFSGYLEETTTYSKHKKIRTAKIQQMQLYILYHYHMEVAVFMLLMHFLFLMLMLNPDFEAFTPKLKEYRNFGVTFLHWIFCNGRSIVFEDVLPYITEAISDRKVLLLTWT